MLKLVRHSIIIFMTITMPKAFAVDNCAFYGHGTVVSVLGTGICSSIDAVSQCSDGSYYYTGTANGVSDSYDAAIKALGCDGSNASSTQTSVAGRMASGSSSQTTHANLGITSGLNGSLTLAAPATIPIQAGQKTTDHFSPEKLVQQKSLVPESQAGQHVTDIFDQTVTRSVKPKVITPPLVVDPLIPAELSKPFKPSTIPMQSNQKAPEITNPAVNTMTNYSFLLLAIVVLCLCLVAIVCFGIKRFSSEKI